MCGGVPNDAQKFHPPPMEPSRGGGPPGPPVGVPRQGQVTLPHTVAGWGFGRVLEPEACTSRPDLEVVFIADWKRRLATVDAGIVNRRTRVREAPTAGAFLAVTLEHQRERNLPGLRRQAKPQGTLGAFAGITGIAVKRP
jgi:hypothetical protein